LIKQFNGKAPKIHETAFISDYAYIVGDVEIGPYSSVWPGAVIRADFGQIRIGSNVSLQDNCVVHCEGMMEIGDNVMFGHGAVMHGKSIGNYVLVGINASILPHSEIGSYCIIGAMTLVTERMIIPDKSFVTGIPGKVKKELTEKVFEWVERDDNSLYARMAQMYKDGEGY